MIFKITLKFQHEEIFVYSYCGEMAEKELLKKWVLEKGFCPICRKKITIDECPLVKIQE